MKKVLSVFFLLILIVFVAGCTTSVEFYIINSSPVSYTLELYLADSGEEVGDIINYVSGNIDIVQFVPETLKTTGFKNIEDVFKRNAEFTLIKRSELKYIPKEKKIVYTLKPHAALLLLRDRDPLYLTYYKALRIVPVLSEDDEFAGQELYITAAMMARVFLKKDITAYLFFDIGDIYYLDL